MKKKALLSTLAVMALALTFTVARADDEGGGNPGGSCQAPWSNICFNVVKNGVIIATAPGVLHV